MIWSLLYRLDKLSRGCILCSAKRVWLVAGVICESGANQIPNGSDGSLMALQMAPALDDMALAVQDVRLERHLRWFANSRVLSTPSTAHSDDRLQMHFYQIYFYCFPFNTPHDRRCRKSTVLSSLVSSLNAKFFQQFCDKTPRIGLTVEHLAVQSLRFASGCHPEWLPLEMF